tara:strand:- start:1988 stop:2317 length:330 start_codon:yes stop_codon:yes gene_type:complete
MKTIDADLGGVVENLLDGAYERGDMVKRIGIYGIKGRLLGIENSPSERKYSLEVACCGEAPEEIVIATYNVSWDLDIQSADCERWDIIPPEDDRYAELKSFLAEIPQFD